MSGVDLAVVGAGPCGLAAGVAARRAGLSVMLFDRGPIVAGLASYPTYMTFFSTAERLSIGGVPFVVADEKPTRRDALAYYRAVASAYDLPVRQYETVASIVAVSDADQAAARSALSADAAPETVGHTSGRPPLPARWRLRSHTRGGAERETLAHAVVVATGYFGRPNLLGVPGETLPHVRHGYTEGHYAWREPVVVVGGGNSAVDAALELLRAEARVSLVHLGEDLDRGVKPWVRPVIANRIHDESIRAYFRSRVVAIGPESVTVEGPEGRQEVPATQVYLMTGFLPETGLLAALGVPIDPDTGIPEHDRDTMATPLPGVYLAGVITAGLDANKIFIENGRDHGDRIVAHLQSLATP
jgi:thioredoxin reductase (NADPH)